MPENREKHNSKSKFYISPTDRLDLLSALTKAQAKEQAKGKKHKKLLEQVDLFVMVALIGHRNNQTGQCDPSQALIASEIGVSESTVKRSFKRLVDAGFMTTTPKYFKGRQTSSQADIKFQKGEPWITKSDDGRSRVTERSFTDDRTVGHGCSSRSVTDDLDGRSPMTDEHSAGNAEKERREKNPPNASRRDAPDAGLDDDRPKPANDNSKIERWPDDIDTRVDKFQSYYPKGGDRSKIADALEEIKREGKTEFQDILRGASNYKREKAGTEPKHIKNPENFLKERLWTGYQRDNRERPQYSMAI